MSQLEERKVISPPPFAASPTLPHPFPSDYPPEVGIVSIKCISNLNKCKNKEGLLFLYVYACALMFSTCLQYGDESSKTIVKCREPDYAGQYSPWSCDTIGSYIGTKDAKPKDVIVPGSMEMMVSLSSHFFQH